MTSNNHIVITAGYDCNSNCIMCHVGSKFHSKDNSTTEEIYKLLVEGRKNKANSVEISGGEPTVRKDLVEIVSLANTLGFTTIGISTNGMLLSDKEYCDKLVKAGLTYITVSLHAPNKKISELISGTPNSFNRTIKGIKNAINHKNLEVIVVTAVQKSNFKHLVELGHLITDLGVNSWTICDLVPAGMEKGKYAILNVNRRDLYKELMRLAPLQKTIHIVLFNLTLCTVPKDFSKNNITTISRKCDETIFFSNNKKGACIKTTTDDGALRKIEICNSCKYAKECAGFWSEYFSLNGEKDIVELAKQNDCLK